MALVVLTLCVTVAHAEVTFDWAYVGDVGNAGELSGAGAGGGGDATDRICGAVNYGYSISKHEVTNAQYTEFLNAKAATDTYALYSASMASDTRGGIIQGGTLGSYTYAVKADAVGQGPGGSDYTYGDKPVTWVCWYDTIRFANWITNSQGTGDTESGSYTITGGGPNSGTVTIPSATQRATWAGGSTRYVLLPSEDEWYKAAYYDPNHGGPGVGGYWDYPTGTDTTPNNNLPTADTGNSANFYGGIGIGYTTGNASYPMTDVGDYTLSASPYGTFDQGGNKWEFNEATIGPSGGLRGGAWGSDSYCLEASYRIEGPGPFQDDDEVGFRVTSVPEPSTAVLTALGLLGLLAWGRRRRR